MPASERTLALRARREGPLTEELLLELKDLRIAQERSAEELEGARIAQERIADALELIGARLADARNGQAFIHGETHLTWEARRKLRAILPVLHAQKDGKSFLAGEVVDESRTADAAGADLAAVLEGMTGLQLGTLLGRGADSTTDIGAVEGFCVLRVGMTERTQRWLIEKA